jgi:hypothetical protein
MQVRCYSYSMGTQSNTQSNDLKKDLERNRDGRLSSRQWWTLITEPLASLLFLTIPLILIVGRFGPAGRWIFLIVILGFVITMGFRAVRFARVRLHYRVLYAEKLRPRWMFWRKIQLMTKSGKPLYFDHHIASQLNLQQNQAVSVYYIKAGDRCVLVSLMPQKHPAATSAAPTSQFTAHNGIRYTD